MDVGRYIQTVAGVDGDLFAVSRDEIRHLLATPPVTEGLLELSVAWTRLLAAENGTTRGADARPGPSFWRQDSYLRVTPPRDRR
jgi:hypothetical protein